MVLTTDIMAMISPEGERVQLSKGLKARGNVEDWLGKVEESMFLSLRRCMKVSILHFCYSVKKTCLGLHKRVHAEIKDRVGCRSCQSNHSHCLPNYVGSRCSRDFRWGWKRFKENGAVRAKVH